MPSNDRPSMHHMDQALRAAPMKLQVILMGGLNARLGDPCDKHEEDLVTALSDQGMVNMTEYFLPRRQYRGAGGWKWIMQRDKRQVMGRGYYILSTDMSSFVKAGIQETRHDTNHRLILAVIWGEGALCNRRC